DWSIESSKAVSLENTLSHSGRNCLRLDVSDRSPASGVREWLGFKQNLAPLSPGKRYLLRAYLRQELRAGKVKATLTIESEKGSKWIVEPSEKGWVRIGGVYTANPEAKSFRISIEAIIESNEYDTVIWADDFLLVELK